jgi:hypothetical protein
VLDSNTGTAVRLAQRSRKYCSRQSKWERQRPGEVSLRHVRLRETEDRTG